MDRKTKLYLSFTLLCLPVFSSLYLVFPTITWLRETFWMSLSLWTRQQPVPGDLFKVRPLKWMPIAVDFLRNQPSAWLTETKQGNEMQNTILAQHLYGDHQLYKSLGVYKWCVFVPAVSHTYLGCILPQSDTLNSQGCWWKRRARSPYQRGSNNCNT